MPFKLLPSAGVRREWICVSSCVGFLRGTAWDSRSFFHRLNPHWVLQSGVMGTYLPGTGTLCEGTCCVAQTLRSWDNPSRIHIHHTWICVGLTCSVSPPPTSLDGCGFFSSVVVRLPFNLLPDGSGSWLFHILVVILMWLCKEVSYVYPCCHFDQKWAHFALVVLQLVFFCFGKWEE